MIQYAHDAYIKYPRQTNAPSASTAGAIEDGFSAERWRSGEVER
jgi:hypothetical protein